MIDLHNQDCLEFMAGLPDNSIDMCLTDPPYGTTTCGWDSIIPFEPMWEQLKRVVKDNGAIVLFGSQPFTSALVMSNLKMFRYEWIWEKNLSGGFILAKKQPMKYHENILVFAKSQTAYYPIFEDYSESTKHRFKTSGIINSSKMQKYGFENEVQGIKRVQDEVKLERGTYPKSFQKFKCVQNANKVRLHPTQKPVALLEYLIKTYTLEGETVLDFTFGSGSTAVACRNTGRNFIGCELDLDYFNLARKRLE
jgi:site-specific DNA-methyltransferase (adenine-specific)